jgi:alpha-L-rhamnosidase
MKKMLECVLILLAMLLTLSLQSLADVQSVNFKEGKPIWLKGRTKEMNDYAGFRAIFNVKNLDGVKLKCTGHNSYRVSLNGKFVLYGPARGPHGFYRVDEVDLSPFLQEGENILAVEAIAYNVNGYGITNQPGFVQAEITQGDNVLCATALLQILS